jgi:hypothetical protein
MADEITTTLELEPTTSHDKGTPISKRNPNSKLRQHSVWILESGMARTEPLESHIEKLALLLKENESTFIQLSSSCEIDIFCGISSENGQGGFALEASLLKKLTAIPVNLIFDLYISENQQEN